MLKGPGAILALSVWRADMSDKITVVNTAIMTTHVCGLRLEPGANEVDVAEWKRIQCDHVRELVKHGKLRALVPPAATQEFKPAEGFPELPRLKPADALKAVAACQSIPQLDTWFGEDGRKAVKDAIVKRRYALEPQTPAGEQPLGDDDDVKVL